VPLPEALRPFTHDPAFWSDFLGEEIYQREYPSLVDSSITHSFPVRINLPITSGYGLTLLKTTFLGGFFLNLVEVGSNRETTIAYDALDGHPFPHGLRWEEVDLFGRCLAARDLEWSHPGLAVLFMSIAAPVTSEEEALAFPLLETAWGSLGLFSGRRLSRLVRNRDRRRSGMEWHLQEPHGWVLRNGHSPRVADSDTFHFPFAEWKQFVAAAEAACPNMDDGQVGSEHSRAVGLIPVAEAAHRLEVQFPAEVDPQMVVDFKRAVIEEGVGQTYWSGGICFPPAEGPMPQDAFDTTLFGDLEEGLGILRRALAKYGPPPGTGIWSREERRHLPISPLASKS
jgi:hypothetical protein